MYKPYYIQQICDGYFILTISCQANNSNWICHFDKKTKILTQVCTTKSGGKKFTSFTSVAAYNKWLKEKSEDISSTYHAGNNWRRKKWTPAFINMRFIQEGLEPPFDDVDRDEIIAVEADAAADFKDRAKRITEQLKKLEKKYNVRFSIYAGTENSKIIVFDKFSGLPETVELELPKSYDDI